MSLLQATATLRSVVEGTPAMLVAFALCLLSAGAPRASLAETSPPQTAGVPVSDGQIDHAITSLDAIAGDLMKKSGIPGMAVAVVRNGKTVYAKGFGVRKVGESHPIDADTAFQIASLSKSLAASVVAHQVGVGAVRWGEPVAARLPWFN